MQGMRKIAKRSYGFTLVEVLVCVVILGIIAVPFFNSFIVVQRTNEKARQIQKSLILGQNIMETVKSKSLEQIESAFKSSKTQVEFHLVDPYDCSVSVGRVNKVDAVKGSYDFSIKRVREGNFEYDIFVSLVAEPFKNEAVPVQNNYQMPVITSLQGKRIAVLNPLEAFTSWDTRDGGATYTKDSSTSLDYEIIDYYYNLHLAYIDRLTMKNQQEADCENLKRIEKGLEPNVVPKPLPSYYPYSKESIKGFIEREIVMEAENGLDATGKVDKGCVSVKGSIIYQIPEMEDPNKNITDDSSKFTISYQIFSKVYHSVGGENPLEQIYLFYEKPVEGMGDKGIVLRNRTRNCAIVNLVLQQEGVVRVVYEDPEGNWKLVSNKAANIMAIGGKDGTCVSGELVKNQKVSNRLYRVTVDVYKHSSEDRTGDLMTTLTSTKEE